MDNQSKYRHEALKVISVDSRDFFKGGDDVNPNLIYCVKEAPFAHSDACEFMIYLHPNDDGDEFPDELFANNIREMRTKGCTETFIDCFIWARQHDAVWLMLHV